MTEIKFRGQPIGCGGVWIYGNSLIQWMGGKAISNNIAESRLDKSNYSEVVHVCRFIGLYDANGVEIYEGDIIASGKNNEIQHIISYNNNDAQYVGYYSKVDYCGVSQKWINEFNKVIIGNKYDNPELVK